MADISFFGSGIDLQIGDLVRVEGILRSDRKGDFALFTRSGSGNYSAWDCVVLRDMSWTQKMFLSSYQSDDVQTQGFEAIGQVAAANVTFGRGDGVQHGSKGCLISIKVESVERLEIFDSLARRLLMRTEDIIQSD